MWSAKVGTFPADRRSREAYLNATFTQQSPRLAIIAFKVRRRDVEYFGYAGFFFFFWLVFSACRPCGAAAVRSVFRSAGAAVKTCRRWAASSGHLLSASSASPLLRRSLYWLKGLCHIAELNSLLLVSLCAPSQPLHPVSSAYERSV